MAGLFGLFGGKDKNGNNNQPQRAQRSREAFFLNPDDAKTLGNIEFMRKRNKIRRTFPKTQKNQSTEFIQEVSSMDKVKGSNEIQTNVTNSQFSSNGQAQTDNKNESQPKRRSNDSSMDLFRNMAKEMKK